MMRFAALAALCAAGVASAHAQGTLYGVATFSTFGTQSLYSINPQRSFTTAKTPTRSSGVSLKTTLEEASDRRAIWRPTNAGSQIRTRGLSTWK